MLTESCQRCYAAPNQRELAALKSTRVLDELHQQLKSLKDYKKVIDLIVSEYPAFRE